MSKFDLEAAKRGKAVQYKSKDGTWKDTVVLATDLVVVKGDSASKGFVVSVSELRMKPKQRKMWTYPRKCFGTIIMETPNNSETNQVAFRAYDNTACGEVQMILVDEE
jgi:hypothetical protein